MNYLYNGVQLPALPEWDREAYPYAFIVRSYRGNVLLQTSLYFVTELDCYVADTGVCESVRYQTGDIEYIYSEDSNSWGEAKEVDATTYDNFRYDTIHWTNTDIYCQSDVYYPSGTLYLAASDPIPATSAPAPDPTSMLMGWLVGRAIAGQRGKKAEPSEPIAYLYNGVQLPDINAVWTDKETYPYAYIMYKTEAGGGDNFLGYRLILTDKPLRYDTSTGKLYNASGSAVSYYGVDYFDGVWGTPWGPYSLPSKYSLAAVNTPVFASYDVLKSSDASVVILAASEPVPVYA